MTLGELEAFFNSHSVKFLVTVAGGGWLLFQYVKNSRAQRAALRREQAIKADGEMDRFLGRPEVRAMLRIIDWDSGAIALPVPDGSIRIVEYDYVKICAALRHHGTPRIDGDPNSSTSGNEHGFFEEEQILRDLFDSFLTRLESINNLIEHGVISPNLFYSHFSYWLKRMAENRDLNDGGTFPNAACHAALWRYIRGYEFTGVIELMGRYGLANSTSRKN